MMTRSKLEESVGRIFMEAAFKLSGALSADMFFLLQTGDGKRRFCGRESLVDDFVAGDLRFKDSDVHFRFFDDADPFDDDDDDDVDDDDVDGDEQLEEELSDVSDGTLWEDAGGAAASASIATTASIASESSSKRKSSASPLEAPAVKTPRKTLKAKTKNKKSFTVAKIPSLMDGAAELRRKSVDAKSNDGDGAKAKRNVNYEKTGKKFASTKSGEATPPTATTGSASTATTAADAASPTADDIPSSAHVILRYLPEEMADANIKSKLEYLFKKYGAKIKEVQIIRKNPKQPRSRYAIVVCESRTQAHKVVGISRNEDFRAKLRFNTLMTAEVIHKFDEHDPRATRTLRVSNVHGEVDKTELRQLFEPFGEIYSFEMRHSFNEKGLSVGMAFIQFAQVEVAVRARERLIGHKLRNLPLLIGFVRSVKSDCLVLNNVDTTGVVHNLKNRFGTLDDVYVKREKRQALLFFRDIDCASKAMEVIGQKKLAGVNVQMDFASVDLQDAFLGKSGSASASASAGNNDDDDGDVGVADVPAEKVNLVRLDDGCGIPVEKFEVASTDELGGIPVEDGASDISDDEMEDVREEEEEEKETTDSVVRSSPTPSDATTTSGGGGPKIIRTSIAATNDNLEISESNAASKSTRDDGSGDDDDDDDDDDVLKEASSDKKSQRLFVGNLGGKITEDDIRTEFERFGKIATLEMSPDNAYCFVKFEDGHDEAHSKAMDALNGKKVGDVEMLICLD